MESDHPGSDSTESIETNQQTSKAADAGRPDPATLVARLIEAGEWPDPELMAQLVQAGDAVVEPLLDFMRTFPSPKDYRREIVLYHGIGILGAIGSTAAIPVLVEILRRYPEESGEEAARVLGDFGAIVFEPALELVQDPEMRGYARRNAIAAAIRAAGGDPAMRARLAEILRPMLADAMERTREEDRKNASEPEETDEDADEGWVVEGLQGEVEVEEDAAIDVNDRDDATDEGSSVASPAAMPELEPYEEVLFLVGDLASLADPEARGLIKTAFAENLVDNFWIDEETIERRYAEAGETIRVSDDWLEEYRERYRNYVERKNSSPGPLRPIFQPQRSATDFDPEDEPAPITPQEPIRNTGPKLGRNDPCWCGSGKKYKKCHLGKPGP
jgi:hypothetical protein